MSRGAAVSCFYTGRVLPATPTTGTGVMAIRRHDVKTRRPVPAAGLDELIARAHRAVVKLTAERNAVQRKLTRARIRYSVLTRLAADESKRQLASQGGAL